MLFQKKEWTLLFINSKNNGSATKSHWASHPSVLYYQILSVLAPLLDCCNRKKKTSMCSVNPKISPSHTHIFIEIIHPSFRVTVLIYRDKRAWLWPWPALAWIADPAASKVPSINSGLSLDYTSYILLTWKRFITIFLSSWPVFFFSFWHPQPENWKSV